MNSEKPCGCDDSMLEGVPGAKLLSDEEVLAMTASASEAAPTASDLDAPPTKAAELPNTPAVDGLPAENNPDLALILAAFERHRGPKVLIWLQ